MKKLNKKGFTLVEVLTVIIIITAIMMISLPVMNSLTKRNNEELYKSYEKMMEEYARNSPLKTEDTIMLSDLDGLDQIKNECSGYVYINHTPPVMYKAYIECGDYHTTGYEEKGKDIPSCPGCVFAYNNASLNYGSNGNTISSSEYKTNYEDVVASTGYDCFLGMALDDAGKIEKAYACGIYNSKPFCIEGAENNRSAFDKNQALLIGLFGEYSGGLGCVQQARYLCFGNVVSAFITSWGDAYVEDDGGNEYCIVNSTGTFSCSP